jgi:hypothetical protein
VNITPHQEQKHKGTANRTVLVSSSLGVIGVIIVALVIFVVNEVHKKNVMNKTSMSTLEDVIQNEDKEKTTARSIVENIIKKVPDKQAMKTLTKSIKEQIVSRVGNRRHVRRPSRSIIEHVSSVNTAKLLTDASKYTYPLPFLYFFWFI